MHYIVNFQPESSTTLVGKKPTTETIQVKVSKDRSRAFENNMSVTKQCFVVVVGFSPKKDNSFDSLMFSSEKDSLKK